MQKLTYVDILKFVGVSLLLMLVECLWAYFLKETMLIKMFVLLNGGLLLFLTSIALITKISQKGVDKSV